jgi:hypothetical protein
MDSLNILTVNTTKVEKKGPEEKSIFEVGDGIYRLLKKWKLLFFLKINQ